MARRIPIIGMIFGNWTVISTDETRDEHSKKARWLCKCQCGTEKWIYKYKLYDGLSTRCSDCASKDFENNFITHNSSKTRLYNIWQKIKTRCYNPKQYGFNNYGGRNITVCPEWKNSFENFQSWALSNGYSNNLEIDRINVDGNYEPNNCRFVTERQNSFNKRKSSNNTSGYKGVHQNKKSKRKPWRANIGYGRKQICLGYFNSKEDAAIAYNEKAKELFGEYAHLNVIK